MSLSGTFSFIPRYTCPFIRILVVESPIGPTTSAAMGISPGLQFYKYIPIYGRGLSFDEEAVGYTHDSHVTVLSAGVFCLTSHYYDIQYLHLG